MAKEKALSLVAEKALEVLKNLTEPVTLAELKELVPGVTSGHMTALKTRGLVSTDLVEKETVRVVKSKVNAYSVVDTDESADESVDESDETDGE